MADAMLETLMEDTRVIRARVADLARACEAQADVVPPTWNNNMRWQVGHLVVTPRLLVFGLAGKDLGVPGEYRGWFAKGSGPAAWEGAPVPPLGDLLREMTDGMEPVFEEVRANGGVAFAEPYQTSAGAVLRSPRESLLFSLVHDGIHLGSALALRRALAAV